MAAVTTASLAWRFRKELIGLGIIIIILFFTAIMMIVGNDNESKPIESDFGSQQLSASVLAYQEPVTNELKKYNLEQYASVVLAIMQQESGGSLSRDVMQSSESIDLAMNSIQDPMYSIQVGVKHFSNVYKKGTSKGVDIETIVQSYNFGGGYIDFIASNGKKHSQGLAQRFSDQMMQREPGKYTCGGNKNNFRWPHCYGDWSYVDKVFKYVATSRKGPSKEGSNAIATGSPLGQDKYEKLYNEVIKFKGYPYRWGGATPSTSFDCSGLTSWAFKQVGYDLPRTAQLQYNATKRVKKEDLKAGDLIFFKTAAYNNVTHVGIYVGNNQMYDANNGGVGFSPLNAYWNPKIVGYGRVS
ncbi:hypothetical protein GFV16_00010 [Bacillus megaterium]|uniref:bifunctional lytic transglycosylase/C40 family peptidase n=1 Tax=Priestia megaterium TaxID=1404 RepID=UPI00129374BA|nr:bifunctional lytic transglycosylase/C40 family peptidase [Priestia megaterium]MQR84327.1 hypothetical protein [Priestia megaterium]